MNYCTTKECSHKRACERHTSNYIRQHKAYIEKTYKMVDASLCKSTEWEHGEIKKYPFDKLIRFRNSDGSEIC